jgi:hypothetical protein
MTIKAKEARPKVKHQSQPEPVLMTKVKPVRNDDGRVLYKSTSDQLGDQLAQQEKLNGELRAAVNKLKAVNETMVADRDAFKELLVTVFGSKLLENHKQRPQLIQ